MPWRLLGLNGLERRIQPMASSRCTLQWQVGRAARSPSWNKSTANALALSKETCEEVGVVKRVHTLLGLKVVEEVQEEVRKVKDE